MSLLFTCEHAGHEIPLELQGRFEVDVRTLDSHRGWDAGALAAARILARHFSAPLLFSEVTRLVADTNRSERHPRVVARIEGLSRAALLARYWEPHRAAVSAAVELAIGEGVRCTHIAVHSFTPELDGKVRSADVGLLYDPARPGERVLALAWQQALARLVPRMRVRRNYPYRGRDDGLPTHLRQRFGPEAYVGFELEFNQAALARDAAGLVDDVAHALEAAGHFA